MGLQVQQLNFSYHKNKPPVLQDIAFEAAQPGQLTVLLGPNAAGKSTLFRLIAGLLPSHADSIYLAGNDLYTLDRSQRSRTVCFMPQVFSSNAALTVFEVVLLARKQLYSWRVKTDDVTAVEQILVRLGIEHLAQRYIGDLSGGQQQLTSIAQALARSPDVYLLDEPTSALDLRHQLQIMTLLRELTTERHVTTIIALHDLNLAARFADQLILLDKGRIAAVGPTQELLTSKVLAEVYGVTLELTQTQSGQIAVTASL